MWLYNLYRKKEKFENNEIYFLENNDINNNELILELIKNLQKCFNGFCSGIVNVFDDMYLKANSNQKKLKELIVFKLDITDKLNTINAPAIIIAGEEDNLTDLDVQKKICDNIKGSRLIVLEKTKHNILIGRNIEKVLKIINDFMLKID